MSSPAPQSHSIWITPAILFATGWAANHFTALMPVLARVEDIPSTGLDAAFGIYALGLLPGLLVGGGLSDRYGRRTIVLTGLALATAGNLLMAGWAALLGVMLGRLVVGVGVALVMSAGTAWASDQDPAKGAARAGVALTSGFAAGPLFSGLLSQFIVGSPGLVLSFVVAVLLTAACGPFCLVTRSAVPVGVAGSAGPPSAAGDRHNDSPAQDGNLGRALAAALPMGLWVFTCIVIAMVVLAGRVDGHYSGPMLPAAAAVLSLGSGLVVQLATRRISSWRPLGIIGALLAAAAFAISAVTDASMSIEIFILCSIVFGCAYGLCLNQGLRDLETLAPRSSRGTATGIFYIVTYSGYGLPFILNAFQDQIGTVTPMFALAALAVASAGARVVHLATPTRV